MAAAWYFHYIFLHIIFLCKDVVSKKTVRISIIFRRFENVSWKPLVTPSIKIKTFINTLLSCFSLSRKKSYYNILIATLFIQRVKSYSKWSNIKNYHIYYFFLNLVFFDRSYVCIYIYVYTHSGKQITTRVTAQRRNVYGR